MTDDADFDYGRLADYVSGDCSPQDAHDIGQWISASPERRELVERLLGAHHVLAELGRRETAAPALEPIYSAVLARVAAGRSAADTFLSRVARTFTEGLAGRVVATLLDVKETTLTPEEVERLRSVIDKTKSPKEDT